MEKTWSRRNFDRRRLRRECVFTEDEKGKGREGGQSKKSSHTFSQ